MAEQITAAVAGQMLDGFTAEPFVRTVPTEQVSVAAAVAEFGRLVEQWRAERPRGADVAAMTGTPAFKAIVGMGAGAIGPLLTALRDEPVYRVCWADALYTITGENPVPAEATGKVKSVAAAWRRWGRERGYIGDVD